MVLEDVFAIVCFVLAGACYIGYRYCSKNVYLKYKEQRAWTTNTKEDRTNE